MIAEKRKLFFSFSAAEVTSSSSTKYSWLSDEPGAKKRSVNQRTHHTRKKFNTDARRS